MQQLVNGSISKDIFEDRQQFQAALSIMLSALNLSPTLTTDGLAVVSRQIEEGRNGRVPAFFFCHTL
jgi:hypothetical protein